MNLIVLSLTYIFCKCPVKFLKVKMVLAAAIGAGLSLFLYLFLPKYVGATVGIAFFVVPLMIFITFGWKGIRHLMIQTGLSWLSIILLNGVVTAVYNLTGIKNLYVYTAVLVLLAARALVHMLVASVQMQKKQVQLTLLYHGRSITCMGLYDSGNLLKMPDSGEPVHIINPVLLEQLLKDEEPKCQMIPFHALGVQEGWIFVCQLEQMRLEDERNRKVMDFPWVGRAQPGLLFGKTYQVILNADVVD